MNSYVIMVLHTECSPPTRPHWAMLGTHLHASSHRMPPRRYTFHHFCFTDDETGLERLSRTVSEGWRSWPATAHAKPCSFILWAILFWVMCIRLKDHETPEKSLTRVGCLGVGRSEVSETLRQSRDPLSYRTPSVEIKEISKFLQGKFQAPS